MKYLQEAFTYSGHAAIVADLRLWLPNPPTE